MCWAIYRLSLPSNPSLIEIGVGAHLFIHEQLTHMVAALFLIADDDLEMIPKKVDKLFRVDRYIDYIFGFIYSSFYDFEQTKMKDNI